MNEIIIENEDLILKFNSKGGCINLKSSIKRLLQIIKVMPLLYMVKNGNQNISLIFLLKNGKSNKYVLIIIFQT